MQSAYINKQVFLDFGRIFIATLNKLMLLDGPVLLTMDGHFTHLFNWEFMKMMEANDVIVLAIPPHTSHVMQPLDKGPFHALKKYWNRGLYSKL